MVKQSRKRVGGNITPAQLKRMEAMRRKMGGALGGSWYSGLVNAASNTFRPLTELLKDTKLISKGLSKFGFNDVGDYVAKKGYGKRHRGGSSGLAVKF